MVDLHKLIPQKFVLADQHGTWPLMVQEWYLHKGYINAEAVASYLDAMDLYDMALREGLEKRAQWEAGHMLFCDEVGVCTCPPLPILPIKPTLDRSPGIPLDRLRLEYVIKHRGCRWPTQ